MITFATPTLASEPIADRQPRLRIPSPSASGHAYLVIQAPLPRREPDTRDAVTGYDPSILAEAVHGFMADLYERAGMAVVA